MRATADPLTPDNARPRRASAIARWLPIASWLPAYDRSWLKDDVVAGLALTALLVPQGMAYAQLAGLPPITGLYTSIMCLVAYAVFGPSRVLVLGPDSSLGFASGNDDQTISRIDSDRWSHRAGYSRCLAARNLSRPPAGPRAARWADERHRYF